MKFRILAIAATVAIISTPALAGHCPKDMKAIDEALSKNPTLSSEQMAEVTKLRADGEAAHKAGKHGDSLAALEKAMAILNVSH
ncbi:MAG: hypothetical protein HQ492_04665 [Woeseiaceae bacterium]|nr:hypothetical protein [Woeseiaceae bacterium]